MFTAECFLDLWLLVKDFVPDNKKKEICLEMLRTVDDHDESANELIYDLEGEDEFIDKVIREYKEVYLEVEIDEEEDLEDEY